MCGIVGLIDRRIKRIPLHVAYELAESMKERGPDGFGRFDDDYISLAGRRLAIVDKKNGDQPMKNADGSIIVFQNGEIYNYRELRQELKRRGYIFRTESDTEIVVHGYEEWGVDGLLKKIDGMFALSIYDTKKRILTIARDKFGEKPLFFAHSNTFFAYSSTTTALTMLPQITADLDEQSLSYYLALHYIPGESTIFKNINRILPGEYVAVTIDFLDIKHDFYYDVPINEKEMKINQEEIASLIEKSVESRIQTDEGAGVFLSGGLDSSIVASIAAKKKPRLHTFSIGFDIDKVDESKYAQYVARHIGSYHHEVNFSEDDFIELLPLVAQTLDEPIGDQALLPLYKLAGEAKKFVTVVLSGEGADEIFGGYEYYKKHIGREGNGMQWPFFFKRNLKGLLDATATPSGFPLVADIKERNCLYQKIYRPSKFDKNTTEKISRIKNNMRRAQITDMATWLPYDLLPKFDKMTMCHGIEGRAPFLHSTLVALGLQLQTDEKISCEDTKILLKKIARQWLPQEITNRKKQGFILPLASWLPHWFQRNGGIKNYLALAHISAIDTTLLCQTLQEQMNQNTLNERFAFAIILLIEWQQKYIAKTAKISYR